MIIRNGTIRQGKLKNGGIASASLRFAEASDDGIYRSFERNAASVIMGSHPAFAACYTKGRCRETRQTLQIPLSASFSPFVSGAFRPKPSARRANSGPSRQARDQQPATWRADPQAYCCNQSVFHTVCGLLSRTATGCQRACSGAAAIRAVDSYASGRAGSQWI